MVPSTIKEVSVACLDADLGKGVVSRKLLFSSPLNGLKQSPLVIVVDGDSAKDAELDSPLSESLCLSFSLGM